MIDTPRRALAATVVVAVVFVGSAMLTGGLEREHLARDVLLLAANTLPLLVLPRHPLAVALLLAVAYPLWLVAGHEAHMFHSLPTLVAMYAVGGWDRPLRWRAVALLVPLWMLTAVLVAWWPVPLAEIGYVAVMFFLGWALGVMTAARGSYARRLEEQAAALADRTAALERARQELADRAVADERSRIARELHDIIAHAMSVITVRAGVGAHLVTARPAEAAAALEVIERTGREALAELRRMLAVLRDPEPTTGPGPRPEPQPGLADLPRLVSQVEATGVVVSQTTEGRVWPVPAGLDLAAFRVVQEALTNVVKHGAGGRAEVVVRYRAEALEVAVTNPGPVADPAPPGLGLRGMAERVALYDGTFEAGPDRDGFRVTARFPRPVEES